MASRRNARNRTHRDPETVLTDAALLANARPNSRNRKRLIQARAAYAARIDGAIPTLGNVIVVNFGPAADTDDTSTFSGRAS